MIPAERRRTILSLLSAQKMISTLELVDHLDVSHMTVRRDIVKLESAGKVISVSGGVQLAKSLYSELSHDIKMEQQADEKMEIGRLAAKLVADHSTIYLDAGTTALEIAHQIASMSDLLVITNDFTIVNYLMANSECDIYHTGGRVDRENKSTVGGKVANFIANMNIDLAFISTSSWNLKGLSTPCEEKVLVKHAIAKFSQVTYLISDSIKYGKVASFHALDIEKIDGVITDKNLEVNIIQELKNKGIKVLFTP